MRKSETNYTRPLVVIQRSETAYQCKDVSLKGLLSRVEAEIVQQQLKLLVSENMILLRKCGADSHANKRDSNDHDDVSKCRCIPLTSSE